MFDKLLAQLHPYLALASEVRLLGFGEGDKLGAWLKFLLPEPELLSGFRGKDTGNKLGQRYVLMLVEIQDDETPVDQERAAKVVRKQTLAQYAAQLCKNPDFAQYLHETAKVDPSEGACADFIRRTCGVKSRSELVEGAEAATKFHRLIRAPFHLWMTERGK